MSNSDELNFAGFMMALASTIFGIGSLIWWLTGPHINPHEVCAAKCGIRRHEIVQEICLCANIDGWEKPKPEEVHP